MTLEVSADFLDDLDVTLPAFRDFKNEGDDHIRNLKKVLLQTFPGLAGRAWRSQSKSANYNVVVTDNMTVLIATAALTFNLDAAAALDNGHINYLIASGGDITVDPDGAETVNGAATVVLPKGRSGVLLSTGAAWFLLMIPQDTQNFQTLVDAASIAWDASLGTRAKVTLGGNRTLANMTGAKAGDSGWLTVIQDATGGRTLAYGTNYRNVMALVPQLSTAAAARDKLYWSTDDGTIIDLTFAKGMG